MKTVLLSLFIVLFSFEMHSQTVVQKYGRLHTSGSKIVDKDNNPVRLSGMSFYWSNKDWGGDKFYTAAVVDNLVDNLKCNVLRIAMGVGEEGGIIEDSASNKTRVRTVIEACVKRGIYVIVCFHSEDAHKYKKQSISFFTEIAKKYGSYDNVIYELNNEPGKVSWTTVVKPYADEVIDSIRNIDPDNLLIVGTTNWAKDVDLAAKDPINDSNVAYAFHFFPGGNYTLSTYSSIITNALNKNIAIFATEWGMADNTSLVDEWIEFMKSKDISICNWSVNDNEKEHYSLLNTGASTTGTWFNNSFTEWGLYVKKIIASYSFDNVSFGNISTNIESHKTYSIDLTYTATAKRELHVDFFDSGKTLLGSGTQQVEAGSGTATLELTLANPPAEGSGYSWRCDIRDVGTDFTKAINFTEISNVSVITSVKIVLMQNMSIVEGKEDGKTFDVLLLNNTFTSTINPSNWTVSNLPTGVLVDTIERKSDNLARVVLKGNSTLGSYSSNITNVGLTISKSELSAATTDMTASVGLVFSKAYSFLPSTYTDGTYKRVNYGFFTPENYDKNKKYPLVMYLHGFGNSQPVYLKFYDAQIQNANPCFVYTPRTDAYATPQGEWKDTWSNWWSTLTEQMNSALEQMDILIQKYSCIDTNRIYVYGISMGGEGVFDLLDKKPRKFAAAIAICGGGRDWWAPNIAKTPFWMFHGGKDDINTPDLTENVYNKLVSIGAKKMRYTNYPDLGHEIWNTAQSEPSFYDWMFAFSKADTVYVKPTKQIAVTSSVNGQNIVLTWNDIREVNSKANKIWYYNVYNSKGLITSTEYNKTNCTIPLINQPDTLWVEAVNYNFQKSEQSNTILINSTGLKTLENKSVRISQFGKQILVDGEVDNMPLQVQVYSVDGALLVSKENDTAHIAISSQSINSAFVVLKISYNGNTISEKVFITNK